MQKWLNNNCSKLVSACWMGVAAARKKLRARTLENHMKKIQKPINILTVSK